MIHFKIEEWNTSQQLQNKDNKSVCLWEELITRHDWAAHTYDSQIRWENVSAAAAALAY